MGFISCSLGSQLSCCTALGGAYFVVFPIKGVPGAQCGGSSAPWNWKMLLPCLWCLEYLHFNSQKLTSSGGWNLRVGKYFYHGALRKPGKIPYQHVYVCVCVCVCAQLCPTLCNPMDYSCPPVSSVHGIFQARILEWVAILFSRGSSWPRDWTHISCVSGIAGGFFTTELPGKQGQKWDWQRREAKLELRVMSNF